MQRRPASLERTITRTTGLVAFYLLCVLVYPQPALAFGLCALTLTAGVWMVIRILKDPHCPKESFEDQFYQDRKDLRRLKRTAAL